MYLEVVGQLCMGKGYNGQIVLEKISKESNANGDICEMLLNIYELNEVRLEFHYKLQIIKHNQCGKRKDKQQWSAS